MKNILVTGGAGFIGSNFVNYIKGNKLLREKYYVCAIVDNLTYAADRQRLNDDNVPFIPKDVARLDWSILLDMYNVDVLVNFAAQTHVDNSIKELTAFEHSNILGVKNIVKHVSKFTQKKVFTVFISTDEVYGDLPVDSGKKFKEKDLLHPNNPYSWTKAAGDLYVQMHSRTFGGLDYAIARATNNYGKNQHWEKFLPMTIKNAILKRSIPVYGRGDNVREWLYTEDFCAGILKIIDGYFSRKREKIVGEIFNFGSNTQMRNIDLAKMVLGKLNRGEDLLQLVADRPGHDKKYALDWTKAKNILGWSPTTAFEDGLNYTISNTVHRIKQLDLEDKLGV